MTVRSPAWTPSEDAHLIELRERGLTGYELHSSIVDRSIGAVKNRLKLLRDKKMVR